MDFIFRDLEGPLWQTDTDAFKTYKSVQATLEGPEGLNISILLLAGKYQFSILQFKYLPFILSEILPFC